MKLIDVTLRDGGHALKFDWDENFAKEYYSLLCGIEEVNYIELGYWKQTAKSHNPFYNLNFDFVCKITQNRKLKNVAIMIDYHYCSHDVSDYPTLEQSEISMIRMCSRKENLLEALEFGKELKQHTGLDISLNIINACNYSVEELEKVSKDISSCPFDYIYFADSHGSIDLTRDFKKFKNSVALFEESGKNVGFHLHNHSGMALVNYKELIKNGIKYTDTSITGIGKGSGNLKLEHVISDRELAKIVKFIDDNTQSFYSNKINRINPYELITSRFGITDNYAKEAKNLNIDINEFNIFCQGLKGVDRDSFNKNLF